MFGIGLPELIVILILALIVLGPEKLPQVAKQVARFMNDLKKASEEFKQELELDKLDDIRNPVKLDSLLGDDLNRLKKDLTEPDFISGSKSGDSGPEGPATDSPPTLGGLGPEWKEASGRGVKKTKDTEAAKTEDKGTDGE